MVRQVGSGRGGQSAFYVVSHGRMLLRVTGNELRSRYAASLLGVGWVVLAPALILAIYATVYLEIFKISVPGLGSVRYVFFIFAGLVPFLSLSEAMAVGVSSVVADKAVLANTVFPIDLVPLKPVLTSQVVMGLGFAVILAGLAFQHALPWTAALLPAVWLAQVAAMTGLNWIISLLNIVFRDLQNLVSSLLMLLLVASPIAYTPAMVPSGLKPLLVINPFAYFVVAYQKLVVIGELPTEQETITLAVLSLGLLLVGSWFFPRAKRVLIDYV